MALSANQNSIATIPSNCIYQRDADPESWMAIIITIISINCNNNINLFYAWKSHPSFVLWVALNNIQNYIIS